MGRVPDDGGPTGRPLAQHRKLSRSYDWAGSGDRLGAESHVEEGHQQGPAELPNGQPRESGDRTTRNQHLEVILKHLKAVEQRCLCPPQVPTYTLHSSRNWNQLASKLIMSYHTHLLRLRLIHS